MLDIKRIRENKEQVKEALAKRGKEYDLDKVLATADKRAAMLVEVEEMKAKRNKVSKEMPMLKKKGEDVTELLAEMKTLSDKIKEYDVKVAEVDEEIKDLLLSIPNTPHESVTPGTDDSDNVEIRRFMEPTKFDFEPKPHWELGKDLGILDFETAAKVTGTRFTFYVGLGARLDRAIMNFMLNLHTEKHGYTEIIPPYIAHERSMIGTGQLPKFADDMFKLEGTQYYLIPTAEVPVTNMYRDTILPGEELPKYHTAFTPCFRAEAGSAGRDTRGLIRQHQFNKVELVKFTKPENSMEELESLTNDAERLLQLLNIPYRVVMLCSGDLGFSSAITYDIEVWMPSYERYVEISSCSNFIDYQARRANIKYKESINDKPRFVHTLNGSGLAVGRTVAAILENYQNEDGSVTVPEVLRKYMGVDIIK